MTRLEEIKAREEKATKGPWVTIKQADGKDIAISTAHSAGETIGQVWVDLGTYGSRAVENSTFLAESREDIPWLIAEVERLRDLLCDGIVENETGEYFMCPWCSKCSEVGDNIEHTDECPAFTAGGEVK